MKLREYGVLLFELSKSNVDTETVGHMAWCMMALVDDWSVDNEIKDADNRDWIQEPYNDWVSAKQSGDSVV